MEKNGSCGGSATDFQDDFENEDHDPDAWLGFSEADCGRWRNGVLTDSCMLAGTEDCDWECPLRFTPSTDTEGNQ